MLGYLSYNEWFYRLLDGLSGLFYFFCRNYLYFFVLVSFYFDLRYIDVRFKIKRFEKRFIK